MNQDFLKASDFDEKTVFRKSKFVGKLALKQSFIWSIYTIKTSKLAFLCILGKVVPEKVVSFFIKVFFVSNFLKIFSFWINCCKTRHILNQEFRMRQTWSRFFTTRQNSNRNILERFRFRKKVLQRARFWSEIVFLKKQILMKLLLSENYFWIVLPKKKFAAMRFQKTNNSWRKKWKKNNFPSRAFAKNQILKKVFNNASDSNQVF